MRCKKYVFKYEKQKFKLGNEKSLDKAYSVIKDLYIIEVLEEMKNGVCRINEVHKNNKPIKFEYTLRGRGYYLNEGTITIHSNLTLYEILTVLDKKLSKYLNLYVK